MKLPECLLDASIICYVLSLGVDPVQVKDISIHLHTVVRVLVCQMGIRVILLKTLLFRKNDADRIIYRT
jgi:hypothetical protein